MQESNVGSEAMVERRRLVLHAEELPRSSYGEVAWSLACGVSCEERRERNTLRTCVGLATAMTNTADPTCKLSWRTGSARRTPALMCSRNL